MPYKNQLRTFLPRAGMIYPSKRYFLNKRFKDTIVMILLERAGFAEPTKGPRLKAVRAVDEALASIFTIAMKSDIICHLTAEDGDLLDFLGVVKDAVSWAERIRESTFIQLCERLVEARNAWQQNPRPPFDPDKQSKTARSIDALLKAIGNRWNRAQFEIYELAGGWEEDDGDEINENNSDCSTLKVLDSDNRSSESVQIEMSSLTTALEEVTDEETIREGVKQMDINDPMDVDND
ncbi:hypothetical protein F4811DRAFT_327141 [Daldinia bambusicola]|nr:hypothetical protein F4811DRAFT_327141 [Daldinia bambusicola]